MKKIISVILALMLISLTAVYSFALDVFVIDNADILSDSEESELNDTAAKITSKYNCSTYIITVESLEGYEAWEYNEMLYKTLSLGYENDGNAVVLMLSMSERKYDIMAHGYGNTVFTDYGKDLIAEEFLDDFANDNWYNGFCDYLDSCNAFLEKAESGNPVDIESSGIGTALIGIVIAIIISCIIALAVCLMFRAQMKTARLATGAGDYSNKLVLTNQYDRFSHRDIRRVYIPPADNNSGGGTTVNSGGFSHKSGSF